MGNSWIQGGHTGEKGKRTAKRMLNGVDQESPILFDRDGVATGFHSRRNCN